jgi:cell division transport system permease protein
MFLFILQEVRNSLKRNFSLAISVILVTFISLSFIGASLLLQMQIKEAKGVWYDKAKVTVFLCPNGKSRSVNCKGIEATESQINAIKDIINSQLNDEVEEIYFESKEDAFAVFEQQYPGGNYEGVTITADDMQASLRLKLVNADSYNIVREVLTGRDGVEKVEDLSQYFEPIFAALRIASGVAALLAFIMLITAALLVSTTIRLSAINRRRETEIMRLVGASNSFIQLPFMIEGAFAATIGALLAGGTLTAIVKLLIIDWLAQDISWIKFIGFSQCMIVLPILVSIGLVLSLFSSYFTLKKYIAI